MRGTFANIRLRNQLAPGTEGGVTRHLPDGEQMSIYDAAMRYAEEQVAARRARRQGVRLGLVARLGGQGHEAARRARRDRARASSASTAPTSSAWACCRCSSPTARATPRSASPARRSSRSTGIADAVAAVEGGKGGGPTVRVSAERDGAEAIEFDARVRIDTPREAEYFRHGGILQYVLRTLLAR